MIMYSKSTLGDEGVNTQLITIRRTTKTCDLIKWWLYNYDKWEDNGNIVKTMLWFLTVIREAEK